MRQIRFYLYCLGTTLLLARGSFGADPAWESKPAAQWNLDDAIALLTASPWVKIATPQRLPDLSPDERRNGGNMEAGIGKGVGLAGLGLLGPAREAEAIQRAHAKPAPDGVVVRWESAPVRAAELKAGENAPAVDDACY